MFDFSFSELLVICVVGLLVLGPKELPAVARTIRGFIRRCKQTSQSIQAQINGILDEEDIRQTTQMIKGDDGQYYESYQIKPTITDDDTAR